MNSSNFNDCLPFGNYKASAIFLSSLFYACAIGAFPKFYSSDNHYAYSFYYYVWVVDYAVLPPINGPFPFTKYIDGKYCKF